MSYIRGLKQALGVPVAVILMLLYCAAGRATPLAPQSPPQAVITIFNVRGFLQSATDQVNKIVPVAGGLGLDFKAQLGTRLKDPQLAGIPPGTNAVLYWWWNGDATIFMPVPKGKINSYVTEINKSGGYASNVSGMLAVTSPNNYLHALLIKPDVARKDLSTTGTESRVTIQVPVRQLLKDHNSELEGLIRTLRQVSVSTQYEIASGSKEGRLVQQALEHFAELWFRSYLAALQRLEVIKVAVTLPEKGVQIDTVFQSIEPLTPRQGIGRANSLLKMLSEYGAIRGELEYDPASLGQFSEYIISQISVSTGSLQRSEAWLKLARDWYQVTDGTMAFSLLTPWYRGYNATYAIGIKDTTACLEMLRHAPDNLTNAGLVDLYATAGVILHVQFQENARFYHGVPIHRMIYKLDITNREQLSMGAMGLTDMSVDLAIVDNVLLIAMGSASIDALIDAAKEKPNQQAELNAVKDFPVGGRFYVDHNIIQAFSALGKMLPPTTSNPLRNVDQLSTTSSSLSVAGYTEEDGVHVSVMFPTNLITALKTVVSNARGTASVMFPDFSGSSVGKP